MLGTLKYMQLSSLVPERTSYEVHIATEHWKIYMLSDIDHISANFIEARGSALRSETQKLISYIGIRKHCKSTGNTVATVLIAEE
jgi:hypothetical protein